MKGEKYWFFLGGRDLEMCAIARLLHRQKVRHSWEPGITWSTAAWSTYEHDISKARDEGFKVVGVELNATGEVAPKDALDIDHHHPRAVEPSSIEQVAKLLGVELSSFEQCVAANDKYHRKGLRSMGLCPSQVDHIRRLERRVLGISAADDAEARSILYGRDRTEHVRHLQGVTIVDAGKLPFGAFTDMATVEELLLHGTDKEGQLELTYYGPGAADLVKADLLGATTRNATYHGGGDSGFFGIKAGWLKDADHVDKMIQAIIEQVSRATEAPHSHHIFCFPATVKFENLKSDKEFETGWSKFKFGQAGDHLEHAEQYYFHPFVRPALGYGDHTDQPDRQTYRWKLADNGRLTYRIQVAPRPRAGVPARCYDLDLEKVTFTWYESGVAVLAFHLNNWTYDDPEEILDINDFGRRLLPPFLDPLSSADPLNEVQQKMLAERISILAEVGGSSARTVFEEEFKFFREQRDVQARDTFLPGHISGLLSQLLKGLEPIKKAVDDRMFVMCWYGNDRMLNCLRDYPAFHEEPMKAWQELPACHDPARWWYRYVFVDNRSAGIGNQGMMHRLNREHAYQRYVDDGIIYGMSRYSFVCLSDRGLFPLSHGRIHMQTVYFQMVLLCLVQRASVLSFSLEVTGIARQLQERDKMNHALIKELTENFFDMRRRYIRFVNLIYFREVTPQEQGIELYEKIQGKMEIAWHVKDLDREIEQLHQFLLLQQAQRREQMLELITKLGFYVAIPTLIVGFFGMNLFSTDASGNTVTDLRSLWALFPALLFVLLLSRAAMLHADGELTLKRFLLPGSNRDRHRTKVPWWLIALAVIVGLILFFPLLLRCFPYLNFFSPPCTP